jgi:hypothetical protein
MMLFRTGLLIASFGSFAWEKCPDPRIYYSYSAIYCVVTLRYKGCGFITKRGIITKRVILSSDTRAIGLPKKNTKAINFSPPIYLHPFRIHPAIF